MSNRPPGSRKYPFLGYIEKGGNSLQSNFQKLVVSLTSICQKIITISICSKKTTLSKINEQLLQYLPRSPHIYKSVDTISNPEEVVNYPIEFLNSLEPPGLPPHRLELKGRNPVMLLSWDPPTLCNGTHLVVKKTMPHVIEATILSECGKGEDVFIPRIPHIPLGAEIQFSFRRVQFPICIIFAMSINETLGKTLSAVELHLEELRFSHEQLNVDCSRVGSKTNLFAFVLQGKTKNIVYQEVL
eukprot:XP_014785162.1 PREDICTED: uncharacterized protein LOC106879923 [Octopus bimaculoides]